VARSRGPCRCDHLRHHDAGGSGIDLVSQLRDIGRPTPVLLVSGFALDGIDDTLAADPSVALLAKPWSRDALAAGIDQVTRGVPAPTTV
jgi:CheY-like chemotaxis protein